MGAGDFDHVDWGDFDPEDPPMEAAECVPPPKQTSPDVATKQVVLTGISGVDLSSIRLSPPHGVAAAEADPIGTGYDSDCTDGWRRDSPENSTAPDTMSSSYEDAEDDRDDSKYFRVMLVVSVLVFVLFASMGSLEGCIITMVAVNFAMGFLDRRIVAFIYSRSLRVKAAVVLFAFLVPYVFKMVWSRDAESARVAAMATIYSAVPVLYASNVPIKAAKLRSGWVIVLVWLWVPLEFAHLPLCSVYGGAMYEHPLHRLHVAMLIWGIFMYIRPLPYMAINVRWGLTELSLIPMLVMYGILIWGMAMVASIFVSDRTDGLLNIDTIVFTYTSYWMYAIPEEIVFQGVIQNLINLKYIESVNREELSDNETNTMIALSGILYAAAHLTHYIGEDPWVVVTRAIFYCLVGWSCSHVWRLTHRVTMSAVLQTVAIVAVYYTVGFSGSGSSSSSNTSSEHF
jgi:hypothetical protein